MPLTLPELPNYGIVRACHKIGIDRPLDCSWVTLPKSWTFGDAHSCDCYKRYGRGQGGLCYLKVEVPIRAYRFVDANDETRLNVGQCPRCRTVFWNGVE
jgi:hypothetical protein